MERPGRGPPDGEAGEGTTSSRPSPMPGSVRPAGHKRSRTWTWEVTAPGRVKSRRRRLRGLLTGLTAARWARHSHLALPSLPVTSERRCRPSHLLRLCLPRARGAVSLGLAQGMVSALFLMQGGYMSPRGGNAVCAP